MVSTERHHRAVEAFDLTRIPNIISPEAFDQVLIDNPAYVDDLVGCTSVSLSHLLTGIEGDGFSFRAYPHLWHSQMPSPHHIYMNTVPEVLSEVFNHTDEQNMSLLEMISENRRSYADSWARSEVLRERLFLTPFTYDHLCVRTTIFNAFHGQNLPESFLGAVDKARSEEEKEGVIVASELLGGVEAFDETLHEMRRRGGVQIVYGGRNEFRNFIIDQIVPPRIDVHTQEIEIELFSDIPSSLIVAVIPVGSYEQGVLLSEGKQVLTGAGNSDINDVL
ncbi:MAG: hypothetical protein RLZZ455_1122 [Candidatus Parcubacteria bacterium]|jgi:hypothetical protein